MPSAPEPSAPEPSAHDPRGTRSWLREAWWWATSMQGIATLLLIGLAVLAILNLPPKTGPEPLLVH